MRAALHVGDAVRVVPGTGSADLLDEVSDLTGEVRALSDEGDLVWVQYRGPISSCGMGLPAADFRRDVALDAAPF